MKARSSSVSSSSSSSLSSPLSSSKPVLYPSAPARTRWLAKAAVSRRLPMSLRIGLREVQSVAIPTHRLAQRFLKCSTKTVTEPGRLLITVVSLSGVALLQYIYAVITLHTNSTLKYKLLRPFCFLTCMVMSRAVVLSRDYTMTSLQSR